MTGTFIYVIEMGCPIGFVKIGISDRPERRLAGMQTANPYPLKLARCWGPFDRPRALQLEGMMHRIFQDDNARGEWFGVSANKIAWALSSVTRLTTAEFEEWLSAYEAREAVQ